MQKPEYLGSVRKLDPYLRIFLVKNGTHGPIRAAHPLLPLICEYPHGFDAFQF